MTPLAVALLVFTLHTQDQAARADCREWHECRQMALDAAGRGDYERFHDLAWRAVQTGPRNDPALMYLLARAQSLSGRPGDALVMLERLSDMAVPTDAATNEDFRRVRALPAWGTSRVSGGDKVPLNTGTGKPNTAGATDTVRLEPDTIGTTATVRLKPDTAVTGKPDAAGTGKPGAGAAGTAAASDALRFSTSPFTPAGLAYDAVSRRFIVGDRTARRLTVIDEFSQHVANLASAQSTGFGNIVALEIDPRQGDLWVVTADGPQSAPRDGVRARLHKLQLISGRALASYEPAERFGEVEMVDVAATADSDVLVLDRAGHRIFRLRPKASALELALTLPDQQPASIAPAADGIVYVSHASGISRADLVSRSVTELKPASGVDVSGISRLRFHKGSLIAVQQTAGTVRVVRIELSTQSHAAAILPLDTAVASIDPNAATVSGGVLYYLAATRDSEITVRRVTLK